MNNDLSKIKALFQSQVENHPSLAKSTHNDRKQKLKSLLNNFMDMEQEAIEALSLDMKKSPTESIISEVLGIKTEADFAIKNLKKWMRSKRVPSPSTILFTSGWVRPEPKGSILILSPWNYPILLCLNPLIAAIAAGNTAVIKPSEFTPASGAFLKKLVEKTFKDNEVAVVLGNQDAAIELLSHPFNHVMFTGSPSTGKLVMSAAAKHLSGVTLELGGKSPVVVDESANISDAAWKLAFYKFANAGQTCTAPDYILCHEDKKDALVAGLKEHFDAFFDEKNKDVNVDYCQIVNTTHFDRIKGYLDNAKELGATVAVGGKTDRDQRFIAPTVLCDVPIDSAVMKEEIFGPLMPIVTYKHLDDAISFINKREKPLALYLFSYNKKNQKRVLEETSSGALVFNDCVIHHTNPNLPFGGINNSGLGSYHGKYGFDAFSHEKAILKSSAWSPFKLMLPPYTKRKHFLVNMIKKLS
jgi:aldehyde dehydrogenase (NAD+)|tara:strand:- start:1898 stop:3307 length:1410 start_codon:yes stop_codon:yes gene_type:complete